MDYATIKSAVDDFFSDTSRSPAETREGLEHLRCEIDMLLDTLPDDEENNR